ncbi:DUF4307 domain-containing protein [Nocardia terpenica]|uniref:DUF4307 domain-containing protein n=1 Tax=Nocardia terpenica TaxID=455432 RepID=A0A161Z0P6_9NOCA|nr:DUF4307 domain-containing protein [Nocardia terpenica]KZM71764.1 hypothetical protein AWN90_00485 [Nocardia terpenica]MBF6060698.1 DUF4307 domain-containing protein [Nocardia terpenica]MBF6103958.1 DUF4307 domain-containing protein [Nocardia terpenica]MBF6111668.1 DUF4307 domain-containing protein [Nocardia terpenica]MBF6118179.1 DUF4307 domain-containing protein [Nocardia terpenica]
MSEAPPDTDPSASRVADRYGRSRRGPRRWVAYALGAVVVLLGLGVAYVGYRNFGPQDIEPDQLGYAIVDDSTLTVHFKVTRKHPDQAVVCFVRAMDADGSEVGRREVLIPPSPSGTVELNPTVRSTARPANGNIYGCSNKVPAYLRPE